MLIRSTDADKQHQTFVFSARMFEIVRALVYTESTFLAEPEWTVAIETYWRQNTSSRAPMEVFLDILPQFVDLGIRALHFVSDVKGMPQQTLLKSAKSLAEEGFSLRSALLHWSSNFHSFANTDDDTRMAFTYYFATSIYLDGIFSYHAPFTSTSAPEYPALSRAVIDEYVGQLLMLSHVGAVKIRIAIRASRSIETNRFLQARSDVDVPYNWFNIAVLWWKCEWSVLVRKGCISTLPQSINKRPVQIRGPRAIAGS